MLLVVLLCFVVVVVVCGVADGICSVVVNVGVAITDFAAVECVGGVVCCRCFSRRC